MLILTRYSLLLPAPALPASQESEEEVWRAQVAKRTSTKLGLIFAVLSHEGERAGVA